MIVSSAPMTENSAASLAIYPLLLPMLDTTTSDVNEILKTFLFILEMNSAKTKLQHNWHYHGTEIESTFLVVNYTIKCRHHWHKILKSISKESLAP